MLVPIVCAIPFREGGEIANGVPNKRQAPGPSLKQNDPHPIHVAYMY